MNVFMFIFLILKYSTTWNPKLITHITAQWNQITSRETEPRADSPTNVDKMCSCFCLFERIYENGMNELWDGYFYIRIHMDACKSWMCVVLHWRMNNLQVGHYLKCGPHFHTLLGGFLFVIIWEACSFLCVCARCFFCCLLIHNEEAHLCTYRANGKYGFVLNFIYLFILFLFYFFRRRFSGSDKFAGAPVTGNRANP